MLCNRQIFISLSKINYDFISLTHTWGKYQKQENNIISLVMNIKYN